MKNPEKTPQGKGSARIDKPKINQPRSAQRRARQTAQDRSVSHSVVFYDHSCPLCRLEMARLKQRDHLDRLRMIDISSATFDPKIWGIELEALNQKLHVRLPAGDWLIAMPAVRHVYQQVGLGWLWWPSRLPMMSSMTNHFYNWFARNRHFVTSRLFNNTSSCDENSKCSLSQSVKGGAA